MNTLDKINLSQLKRCDQQWENMTPVEKGRICGKCEKIIIDFRNFSPLEIAQTHTYSPEPVCGLYTREQLAKPKIFTVRPKKKWQTLYLGLLGLFYVNQLPGQEVTDTTNIIQTQPDYRAAPDTIPQPAPESVTPTRDSIIVSGKLTGYESEPIIYGSVLVKGTQTGVSTDFDGNYSIDLTEFFRDTTELTLVFSYIGYQKTELILSKNALINPINRELTTTSMVAAEIIEFGIVIKPPLHKRIWNGIKNLFSGKD
ncbi:MAG: hypothetical protein DWQ02_12990 [Bacteroidetes bacterium]|nr:MAG: hypothetical protein DWQ02_12990 [Bacteroidota bacterium]